MRELLQSCVSIQPLLPTSTRTYNARVWSKIADLPVIHSTCESFHGRLLAVGGSKTVSGKYEYSTAVHIYNSITDSWEIISHMITGRSECFTAVLPDNQLMVVGGTTASGITDEDTVEFANVY